MKHLARHRKPKYTQSEDFHQQLTKLSFNVIWLSCAVIAVYLVVGITSQAFNTPRPQPSSLYPSPAGSGGLDWNNYPDPVLPSYVPVPTPSRAMATATPHHQIQPPQRELQPSPTRSPVIVVPLPPVPTVLPVPVPSPASKITPLPTPSESCKPHKKKPRKGMDGNSTQSQDPTRWT